MSDYDSEQQMEESSKGVSNLSGHGEDIEIPNEAYERILKDKDETISKLRSQVVGLTEKNETLLSEIYELRHNYNKMLLKMKPSQMGSPFDDPRQSPEKKKNDQSRVVSGWANRRKGRSRAGRRVRSTSRRRSCARASR